MAIGGPAAVGGVGFIGGYMAARERAIEKTRVRLAEQLRIQKEVRTNEEAIARETLHMKQAQDLGEQAQQELQLLHEREAQIQNSPGKSYKADPYLADKMLEAEHNLQDAQSMIQEHQRNLSQIVYNRNQIIDNKNIPIKGGFMGFGGTPMTPEELKKDPKGYGESYAANQEQEAAGPDEEAFAKERDEEIKQLHDAEDSAYRQKNQLEGMQKRQDVGREEQRQINEDEKYNKLYSLHERETALNREALDSRGAVEAAAQEIAARQREQQFIASQPNPYGQHQGTGLLGLIGSIFNKAGGSGSPGQGGGMGGPTATPPMRPPTPQPPMRPPTPQPVARPQQGQVPTLGHVAQQALNTPVHQIVPALKQLFGGPLSRQMAGNQGAAMPAGLATAQPNRFAGAPMPPSRPQLGPTYGAQVPPVRPRFDQPQMPPMNTGAFNPVMTDRPALAMQGRGGGGTPQSSDFLIQKYFQPQYQDMARRVTAGESASGRHTMGDKGTGTRPSSFGDFQLHEGGIAPGGNRVAGWGDDFFRDTGLHASDPSTREAQYKWVADRVAKEGGFKPGIFHAMNQPGFNRGSAPKPSGPVGRQYAAQTSTTPYSGGGGETSPQPQQQQQQPQQQAAQQPRQLEAPQPGPPLKYSPQSSAQMASQGPQGKGQGPQRPNVGAPTIHNEQELAGLKPGSIFRTPDGRLKIVPMPAAPQPQQAQPAYAGE